jgi:D-xylose transport system substrate-binding protein
VSGKVRSSLSSSIVRLTMACVVAGASTAACAASNPNRSPNTDASSSTATRSANANDCMVGISWFAEAGQIDLLEPSLVQSISAAGAKYLEENANAVAQEQTRQIDGFVAAGARVIIIEPGDESAFLPAVQRAIKAGIPIISLVNPLEHAPSLYVDFDPVEQGRQEARALLAVKPKGTYAIIGGVASRPQTKLIVSGIQEILQPATDRGDIRIVATVETPGWDSYLAQQEMATILSQNGGSVDAVATEFRDLAWGVREALKDADLTGKVVVAGTGTTASTIGLASVVDGTQTVEVWGDPARIGVAAAQAAVALCHEPDIAKVAGSSSVTWPGRDPMRAILLTPVAITRDNLSIVVQTSAYWRQMICDTSGRVYVPPPACQVGPVPVVSASAQSQP